MNANTAIKTGTHERPAPEGAEDKRFLEAIRDPEKRKEVIAILKRAGSIPG